MADFNELLDVLRNPGEDGPPDTIYDDIAGAYQHDVETRDAKISENEARIMESESEISKLKSANYDLMMNSSSNDNSTTDDTEDEPVGVDSLFDDE